MKDRIITAFIIAGAYVGIVLLSLSVSAIVFDIFVLALMFISALEMSRVIEKKTGKPLPLILIISIFFAYALFYVLQNMSIKGTSSASDFAIFGFFIVLAIMFLVAVAWVSFDKSKDGRNLFATAFVLIYPIAILSFMLNINYISFNAHRSSAILLLFLTSTFTDVMAFIVGIKVGGPKLAPKISPKKTISGAIGGLFGGMIAGLMVYIMVFSGYFTWLGLESSVALPHYIIIGFLGSIFTQCGDLLASYVKRRHGVKDYGRFLKGHGGVMDRIDGMMLSAFIINLYMMILVL